MTDYPRPIKNRAVVQRDPTPEKSSGNVLLPGIFHEGRLPVTGTVIAVGPGKIKRGKRIPPEVKPGDRVILKKYLMPAMSPFEAADKGLSGADVKHDVTGEQWFTLVQDIDEEILGILEKE
jgi:chaperonin GroES